MRTLLQRNVFWYESARKYLEDEIDQCASCLETSKTQKLRKSLLFSLNYHLNEVVCIEHLILEGLCILHAMDTLTQ